MTLDQLIQSLKNHQDELRATSDEAFLCGAARPVLFGMHAAISYLQSAIEELERDRRSPADAHDGRTGDPGEGASDAHGSAERAEALAAAQQFHLLGHKDPADPRERCPFCPPDESG